jgi:hypothetical protein
MTKSHLQQALSGCCGFVHARCTLEQGRPNVRMRVYRCLVLGPCRGNRRRGVTLHTAVERGGNCQPASAVDQHGKAGPGAWHMPQAVRHASVVLPAQPAGGGMSRSSHACVLLPLVASWSLHVPPAWLPWGCFADHCCHGSTRGLVVAWITGHTPCTGATVV